jgi:hypothetical protein
VMAGSRITAARVVLGAISLSTSGHFAPMPQSNWVKPVMLQCLAAFAREPNGALVVIPGPVTIQHRQSIIAAAGQGLHAANPSLAATRP